MLPISRRCWNTRPWDRGPNELCVSRPRCFSTECSRAAILHGGSRKACLMPYILQSLRIVTRCTVRPARPTGGHRLGIGYRPDGREATAEGGGGRRRRRGAKVTTDIVCQYTQFEKVPRPTCTTRDALQPDLFLARDSARTHARVYVDLGRREWERRAGRRAGDSDRQRACGRTHAAREAIERRPIRRRSTYRDQRDRRISRSLNFRRSVALTNRSGVLQGLR